METYTSKKISKNIFSITIGQTLSLIINFFSISLTARFLNVADFGNFNFIIAVVFIISKLTDIGVAPITFRETSKNKNDFSFIHNALFIRASALVIIFILFNLFIGLFGLSKTEIVLANILFINIIISSKFQNIRDIMDVLFKVHLEMHYSMLFSILDNFVFLILILFIPYIKAGLTYVLIAYVISNIPGFILSLIFLKRKYNFKLKLKSNKYVWMLKESLPIGGFVLLVTLFQQFDIVILKNFGSSYATGIYSAANRLIIPLAIIPTALATTFFPKIVENIYKKGDNEKLITLVYKVLFFISFMLAITISFKAEWIITTIFGKAYAESSTPMIILFWSYVFLFFNYFSSDIITAYNKQFFNFMYSLLVVIIDLMFIFILLPTYSYNGVAIAKLLASFIGSILIVFVLIRIKVKVKFFSIRVMLWCASVSISLYFLSALPMFFYLIATLLILVILFKIIKFFDDAEIIQILRMINRERWARLIIKN